MPRGRRGVGHMRVPTADRQWHHPYGWRPDGRRSTRVAGEIRDQHDEQAAAMAEATALTRAGRLAEATALIQRTLAGSDGRGRGAGPESPLQREGPVTESPS